LALVLIIVIYLALSMCAALPHLNALLLVFVLYNVLSAVRCVQSSSLRLLLELVFFSTSALWHLCCLVPLLFGTSVICHLCYLAVVTTNPTELCHTTIIPKGSLQ